MGKTTSKEANVQLSVEERLRALYNLQRVDTEIDKIKILRGELPLEVQDLEDEVAGLETRLENYKNDIVNLETAISNKKIAIKESEALIAKYTEQQKNVRNNREYDSLSKEIEFQTLEIELSNKKIKQFFAEIESKKIQIEEAEKKIADVKAALQAKKEELENIVNETQKEEEDLKKKFKKIKIIKIDKLKLLRSHLDVFNLYGLSSSVSRKLNSLFCNLKGVVLNCLGEGFLCTLTNSRSSGVSNNSLNRCEW